MTEQKKSPARQKAGTAAATKRKTAHKPASGLPPAERPVLDTRFDEASRLDMIREAAYFRALNRGFAADTAQEDDWYRAEREIDGMLGKLTS